MKKITKKSPRNKSKALVLVSLLGAIVFVLDILLTDYLDQIHIQSTWLTVFGVMIPGLAMSVFSESENILEMIGEVILQFIIVIVFFVGGFYLREGTVHGSLDVVIFLTALGAWILIPLNFFVLAVGKLIKKRLKSIIRKHENN